MRVSAQATSLHVSWTAVGHDHHAARGDGVGGRSGREPARSQRASSRMAKRRVSGRSGNRRSLIALVLIGFVVVTSGVVARRVRGVNGQRRILELQRKREALDAERTKLESAIRDASSRARLQPIAEQRLNMHIPKPEQQVILPRPAAGVTARPQHDSV